MAGDLRPKANVTSNDGFCTGSDRKIVFVFLGLNCVFRVKRFVWQKSTCILISVADRGYRGRGRSSVFGS